MPSNNYKKQQGFEKVLSTLNESLFLNQREIFHTEPESKSTVHVIGAPRSGTTFLTQLILSGLDIGYINNLIATFWKAPLFGIHLSKKLLAGDYLSNFESYLGRTKNIQEPHEFGYFWKYHLNYSDLLQQTYNENHKIDWNSLVEIVDQMSVAFEKPILFKSFLFGFHAEEAVSRMPKSIFLLIKRDNIQNAYSILKLREKMYGDIKIWASIKPYQYNILKNENIFRQIMGQVILLNYEYQLQLNQISESNKLIIDYSDLCKNPVMELIKISAKISLHNEIASSNNFNPGVTKEILNNIPKDVQIQLESAQEWVYNTFPEINNSEDQVL